MNRQTRTLIVVLVAVVMASLASFAVYRAVQALPFREVEVAQTPAVVATRRLPAGTLIGPDDAQVVAWPAKSPIPGAFANVQAVVNRGVVSTLEPNEPITEAKLVPADGGAGLPPIIPQGMRAISVKVDEVVGVAGFVVPGTRVDVMVILAQENGTMARVVVSNVQVLTAGTKYDLEMARQGQAVPSSVVTLMATPEDAQKIGLAASEGRILLTLRNPLDNEATDAPLTNIASLAGTPPPPPVPVARPAVVRVAAPPPPPPPPPAPTVYSVEAIRAAKRSEEIVR